MKSKVINYTNSEILQYLNSEPQTLSQLSRKMNTSRATLWNNITALKREKLVKGNVRGTTKPTYYSVNKSNPNLKIMMEIKEIFKGDVI